METDTCTSMNPMKETLHVSMGPPSLSQSIYNQSVPSSPFKEEEEFCSSAVNTVDFCCLPVVVFFYYYNFMLYAFCALGSSLLVLLGCVDHAWCSLFYPIFSWDGGHFGGDSIRSFFSYRYLVMSHAYPSHHLPFPSILLFPGREKTPNYTY